jgi:hypothetical protein
MSIPPLAADAAIDLSGPTEIQLSVNYAKCSETLELKRSCGRKTIAGTATA